MTWTNVKTWELSAEFGTSVSTGPHPGEWDVIWTELFEEWLPSIGHKTYFHRREIQSGQNVVEYGWIAYNTDVKDLTPAPNNLWVRWFPDNVAASNSGLLDVFVDKYYDDYPGGPPYVIDNANVRTHQATSLLRNSDFMPVRLWLSDQKTGSFMMTWQGKIQLAWFDTYSWVFTDSRYPPTAAGNNTYTNRSGILPMVKDRWNVFNAVDTGVSSINTSYPLSTHSFQGKMFSDNAFIVSPLSIGTTNLPDRISTNADDIGIFQLSATYRGTTEYTSYERFERFMEVPYFVRMLVNNREWWLVYQRDSAFNITTLPFLAFKCSEELPPPP